MSNNKLERAIKLSSRISGSDDISFCNPDKLRDQCYECKRFLFHLRTEQNRAKNVINTPEKYLHSYFSDPVIDCQGLMFRYFIDTKKKENK